jgi:hypothetical protein
MKSITPSVRRLRAPSAALSVALLSGAFLAAASPAQAVVEDGFTISGSVSLLEANGDTASAEGAWVDLFTEPRGWPEELTAEAEADADGNFSFEAKADGTYSIDVWMPVDDERFVGETVEFTVAGADVVLPEVVLMTGVPEGEVSITGKAAPGQTLTAVTDGWPSGTDLTYQWFFSGGQFGGPFEGATEDTYTVTKNDIGLTIGVQVTGEKDGFAATSVQATTSDVVSVPKQAAAPAPVANSDDLDAFLADKGAVPMPQEFAGLPSGSLNPAKGYDADLMWFGADSFVDVYVYSTPVFAGTFPVVNGVAEITLSSDVLSQLGGGAHTLVVLGQSSGTVGSVELSIAATLAATGVDPVFAFSASGFLLLLGGASLFAARRMRSKA